LPEPTGPVGPVHWGSYLGDLLERVMAVTTPLRVTLPTFSDSTRTWSPTSTIVASSGRDELRPPQVFPGDRRAHASAAVVTVVLTIRSSPEAASDTLRTLRR
jgi:hypothetical protein